VGARQGFATALAAILSAAATAAKSDPATAWLDAQGVVALMEGWLEVTGSMKGSVSGISPVQSDICVYL
jgi:hypothetical protein